ncbi:hypothetical protein MF6396_11065 [Pseudomonas sp. MF6396]|nr:hypothetical protein MF6396_11065 [Pseudomonas sp. MF6396]
MIIASQHTRNIFIDHVILKKTTNFNNILNFIQWNKKYKFFLVIIIHYKPNFIIICGKYFKQVLIARIVRKAIHFRLTDQ